MVPGLEKKKQRGSSKLEVGLATPSINKISIKRAATVEMDRGVGVTWEWKVVASSLTISA